jgi:Mrp family chromosome partitioning ATPase/uncharacterized protein involved in exopolysaccharide biosynthesis
MTVQRDASASRPVFVEGHAVNRAAGATQNNALPPTTPHAPTKSANVGRIIHRSLRGHYAVVITLGLLCGAVGGVSAWRLGHAIYESQGLLRIANSRPIVVQSNDINGGMAPYEFDSFMQSQKQVISSRRIVDAAIEDPVWSAMGKAVPQPPDQYFSLNMKVDVRSRSEIIQITVADRDPGTAAAAVTSIVNAYNQYYTDAEKRTDRQRNGVLADNEDALKAEIKRLAAIVEEGSKRFGGSDPELLCTDAVRQVTRLKAVLSDVQAAISAAPTATAGAPASNSTVSPDLVTADLTAEQLSLTDPVIQNLLDEQERAEQNLRRLSSQYGPAHPQVAGANEALAEVRRRVAKRAALDNAYRRPALQNGANSAGHALIGRPIAELKVVEQKLRKQLDEATQTMDSLADARMALVQDEAKLNQAKQDLARVEERMESVRREGAVGGRLEVVSSGDVPISPARDLRPRIAAGAALGGLLSPAALTVLYSLMRRRYRYADDTDADGSPHAAPLLGILPELRKDGSEHMAAASHCVHQIRMSLNALTHRTGSRVYLVTSATAGEGKTTLTMSLGLSFAASRARTLIIDADLVGRKLTGGFDARETEGLHESIATGTIRHRVRRTDSGLYILTAGKAVAADACAIPKAAIRSVIAEARSYFDVILMDSGPIMGSLEASVLAPEVDGVIFAISRGQGRQAAEAAMRRLRGLGANVVGCVFNRAKSYDLAHSNYGSSSRMSLPDAAQQPRAVDQFVTDSFGPVVQAVASAMPGSQN